MMGTRVEIAFGTPFSTTSLTGTILHYQTGMSLPMFPSTSGTKPGDLHVYTIEECQSCKLKTKRDFKVGDYIPAEAGVCEKCQGKKVIAQIYGEPIQKR